MIPGNQDNSAQIYIPRATGIFPDLNNHWFLCKIILTTTEQSTIQYSLYLLPKDGPSRFAPGWGLHSTFLLFKALLHILHASILHLHMFFRQEYRWYSGQFDRWVNLLSSGWHPGVRRSIRRRSVWGTCWDWQAAQYPSGECWEGSLQQGLPGLFWNYLALSV